MGNGACGEPKEPDFGSAHRRYGRWIFLDGDADSDGGRGCDGLELYLS